MNTNLDWSDLTLSVATDCVCFDDDSHREHHSNTLRSLRQISIKMQALPPAHVYSGTVTNNSPTEVELAYEYAMPAGAAAEKGKVVLKPGETHSLEQKTVPAPEGGSYTMTGHIRALTVGPAPGAGGVAVSATAPWKVAGPTKNHRWSIVSGDAGYQIVEA